MIKIYLAGKVAKGDEIGSIENWRIRYQSALSKSLDECLVFLDPEDPDLDESNSLEVVGHDCSMIQDSDLIIVNAEKKLGVGTAQEMIVAKYYRKYVVSVIPDNSHYSRVNLNMYGSIIPKWIHPFMNVMSDKIVCNLAELRDSLPEISTCIREGKAKDISVIDESCLYYTMKKSR